MKKNKKASEDFALCKVHESYMWCEACKRNWLHYASSIFSPRQQWAEFKDDGKGNCINYLDRRGCQDRRIG